MILERQQKKQTKKQQTPGYIAFINSASSAGPPLADAGGRAAGVVVVLSVFSVLSPSGLSWRCLCSSIETRRA